ncbi:MAG: porin family protein [Proteobacteria bacterium]|nr:porin family protein [Pseudomonadota bacterium]
MKKIWLNGVSAFALTAVAGPALVVSAPAQAGNAYLALGGGFANLGDRDFDFFCIDKLGEGTESKCRDENNDKIDPLDEPARRSGAVNDFDMGPVFEGAIGYNLGTVFHGNPHGPSVGLRIELQATYIDNDTESILADSITKLPPFSTPAFGPLSGHLSETLLMANLLLDIDQTALPGLTPYIGGGIGVVFSELDAIPLDKPKDFVFNDAEDTGFVWQVIVGASVGLTPNLELYANYRLIGLPDMDLDITHDNKKLGTDIEFDDELIHAATVGIRYNFR